MAAEYLSQNLYKLFSDRVSDEAYGEECSVEGSVKIVLTSRTLLNTYGSEQVPQQANCVIQKSCDSLTFGFLYPRSSCPLQREKLEVCAAQ